jgi:two-component system sensor histidine kinase YesM
LLKDAELERLRSQVNPHFIFNVLETISWEARLAGNENVYKMITGLGTLIRSSIGNETREKVTIAQELEYVDAYLSLQRVRFQNRLKVDVAIDDKRILRSHIPKLALQTAVENAIVHGIEDKRGESRIEIRAGIEDGWILLTVQDDGIGFDAGELNPMAEPSASDGHARTGLLNTDKRIRLIYGEDCGIRIESTSGVGTRVFIKLPVDYEEG